MFYYKCRNKAVLCAKSLLQQRNSLLLCARWLIRRERERERRVQETGDEIARKR